MSDFQKGILPIHCKSDESNVICCSNESLASHIGSRAYKSKYILLFNSELTRLTYLT